MIPADHEVGIEVPVAGRVAGETQPAWLRPLLFGSLAVAALASFWASLYALWNLSLQSDTYSFIPLVPIMSAALLFWERKRVFGDLQYSFRVGLAVLGLAIVPMALAVELGVRLGSNGELFLKILSLIILLIAGFIAIFGVRAFRAASFALLLMLLMVPLPPAVIDQPIILVQHGSADFTALLYRMLGIPAFRQGMSFSLPGLDFVVAYECSGIHSTLALLIGSLLAGHFYLRRTWKKVFLVGAVLPIVCFTNGLRMFILSVLAIYVDPSFFHGNLHHKGGIFFFALGLVLLALLVKPLRRPNTVRAPALTLPKPE